MKIVDQHQPEKPPVSIEFTWDELRDLRMIVGGISGSPSGSPRGTSTKLFQLLDDLGVTPATVRYKQEMKFPTDEDLGIYKDF